MHDRLVQEATRALDKLGNVEPTDAKFALVEENAIKLVEAEIKHSEAADRQNERQDKLELERDKMDNEFKLKSREMDIREKELELRNKELDLRAKELDAKERMEYQKVAEANADMAARRRAEKKQAWWELIKIPLTAICSGALIVVTGRVEQHAILGQHQWSLIPKK